MSHNHSIRNLVLASRGNQTIYATGAPGTAIYSTPSSDTAEDSIILVSPGQWVIVDADTLLSIDATATHTTHPNIRIGLAVDLDGDGISDLIQWVTYSNSGCSLLKHSAVPAACGVGSIVDVLLNGLCVEAGKTYSLDVVLYDPETEAFGERNQGYIWTFSYTVPTGGCPSGNCPPTVNADTLMCGLYNVIKGINVDPNWDIRLNNIPTERPEKFPFELVQLYDAGGVLSDETIFNFCFTEISATCATCDTFSGGVSGFTATGFTGETAVTFDPEPFITTGTGEDEVITSKRIQLQRVADLITTSLNGKGQAVYLAPTGNCCTDHFIQVSTCLTDFVLLDQDGAPISPCTSENPYAAVTTYNECKDCAASNGSWTPTIGWRFFFKAVQAECQCIPGNKSKAEYFAEGQVYPHYGFDASGTIVIKKQEATVTEGQGFQWQSREMTYLEQYGPLNFVEGNYGGIYGLPEANDITKFITTNCKDSYCAIHGDFAQIATRSIQGLTHAPQVTAHLLIPKGDSATITSLLAFWNAYFAGGACGLPTISCS